jgi:hypothetical protein
VNTGSIPKGSMATKRGINVNGRACIISSIA